MSGLFLESSPAGHGPSRLTVSLTSTAVSDSCRSSTLGVGADSMTDLTPFWNSQSSYWKSSELRDPTIFNYSYPEFNDLYTLPAPERRRKLIEKIKELYAPGWQVPSKHQGPDYREWSLHIKFKKYQLGAPFTVLVYLGDVYVGTVTAFVPGRETKCANCRRNVGTEIEGFVFLNEVLFREYQDLPSTKNEDVLPILKDLKFKLAGSKVRRSLPLLFTSVSSINHFL